MYHYFRDKNEQLNETISTMQQRLTEAKHDMSRIQNSKDLLEDLKNVETERDVLVDFIQTDMKKSATLSEKLNDTELILQKEREERLAAENKFKLSEENILGKSQDISALEERIKSLEISLEKEQSEKKTLDIELKETTAALERKNLEAEELFKMQTSLLSQVRYNMLSLLYTLVALLKFLVQSKAGDANRDTLEKSLREMSAKCHELELQIGYLKKDNDMFVQKNSLLQEEVLTLTNQIKDVEPRLMQLEPEYNRLREEKTFWASQKESKSKELNEYKIIAATLDEINQSLLSVSFNDDDIPEEMEGIKWNQYTLSQKHVMWCGIPALRRLSSTLYDRIRAMFQDLRKIEKEWVDCRDNYEVDMDDLKDRLDKKVKACEHQESVSRELEEKFNKMDKKLSESKEELHKTREACAILDNVRLVLKSSACCVIDNSRSSPSKEAKLVDRNSFQDGLQQPVEDINLQELSEQFVIDAGTSGRPHQQKQEQVCFLSIMK